MNPQIINAGNALLNVGQTRGAADTLAAKAKELRAAVDKVANEARAAVLSEGSLTEEQKNGTCGFIGLSFGKLRAQADEWAKQADELKQRMAELDRIASEETKKLDVLLGSGKLKRALEAAWRELQG